MSLSGTTNTYLPPTLDGLNIIDADAIYINGIPIDTENLVPYTNATKNVNLGTFNFQTLGSISAKDHVFPTFGSTMMIGPTASSIFYADAWRMSNTVTASSLGGGLFLSTSYLTIKDATNASTLLTLQSDQVADFANTKVRVSTMATSSYDVVNLSTLTSAVAFIENVNALNYVPYTGATDNLNMGGSTIKTTGYVSTAYLTLSESTNGEAWSLYTLSTLGNLSTLGGLVIQETTSGNSVYLTGGVVGAKNFQFSSPGGGNAGKIVCTNGYSVMSTTISAGQLEYINGLHSNAGGVGETNTWSNTQTFSVAPTLNGLTTTTPSFTLGVDGSNQVIKFTPTTTNLLPLNNTWTGATNTFNDVVAGRVTTPAHTTYDNRAISPSDIPLNSHKFYFGEMDNSANGPPYADVIGMQGWADGSGGASNLLMLNKNAIGMRVFQGTYGSTSPFTTYKDVQMVESNGDVIMSGSLSLGNRLLGSPDASPTGNFWMGLRGSGTEADRLAIAITGNATTGAVSLIGLNKPTTCVGLTVPTGNLDVGTGVFNKLGTTAGYGATINGGNASFSPFMEFFAGGLRRLYIGYTNTVDANIWAENGVNMNFGTNGALRMKIDPAGKVALTGELTVAETSLIGFTTPPTTYPFTGNKDLWVNGSIYSAGMNAMVATFARNTTSAPYNDITFVSNSAGVLSAQIKSHTTGSSLFNDATWTYSNTNANPLGSNQGQVLLQADKMSMSLLSGFIVGGLANIHGGSPSAVPSGFMATGSLTLGDTLKNYGGGTGWNSNTAGLLFECLDNTEIMVHDAGARVTSLMYYTGANNTITMGRDAGWGIADVATAGKLTVQDVIRFGNYSGGNYDNIQFMRGTGPGQYPNIRCQNNYIAMYVSDVGGWMTGSAVGDMVLLGEAGRNVRLGVGGVSALILDSANNVTMTHQKSLFLYNFGTSNNAGFKSEASGDLSIFTGTAGVSTRMTIKQSGDATYTSGDQSYIRYGPNATWNSYLTVGATPDRSGPSNAQVITTNGNLHMDAGNSNGMYYGYYANARGTPNPHYFFGDDYQFNGVAHNYVDYAQVCVFVGNQMRRSQCLMRQIYREESINWSGGINMTYALYRYNSKCPVKISGKYSCYSTFVGMQEVGLRLYCQSTGAIFNYGFKTYQNLTYVQTTYPFEIILSEGDLGAFNLGWFDLYMYGVAGLVSTDANNQLHVCVQILPVNGF
jgi:hypothetical protein